MLANRLTVLVAEDDPNDALLLRLAAGRANLNAELGFVPDGQQAINYLKGLPPFEDRNLYPLPALILLDLAMPGTSGFEVLEWVQNHACNIPVIAISGLEYRRDVERALALGAASYIAKPQDPNVLVREMELLAIRFGLQPPAEQLHPVRDRGLQLDHLPSCL